MVFVLRQNLKYLFSLTHHQQQNCCHGNSTKCAILFLLWCTFMMLSFKNTALIFPEISLIQYFPLFSCKQYDVITDLICIIEKMSISLKHKKIFQKEKRHSSVFWKAFQISAIFFSSHRHFKVELSDRVMANISVEVIGLYDFRCYLPVLSLRKVWHLCNLPSVYTLFSLISIARYAFKFPRICFRRTQYEIYQVPVCLLAFEFYIVMPGPALIRTVCNYSRLILITDNISAFRTFFSRDAIGNNLTQWLRNALRNMPHVFLSCKIQYNTIQ